MEEITPSIATAVAAPITQCNACYHQVASEDVFCNNCGYPLHGTEEEQAKFKSDLAVKQIDLADYEQKIKMAGQRLYVTAALVFLGGIIDLIKLKDDPNVVAILIVYLIICGIFVFLATWSKKKPFAALVSGISLYGILTILSIISDPVNIIRGIYFKIIIIGALIQGIKAAIEAEKIKKESHL